MTRTRQLWLTNETGRRKLREVLSSQLISMIFSPGDLWLASPWATDFDLLDNRSGSWNSLEAQWSFRFVRFSEVLIKLMESGCRVRIVTLGERMDQYTQFFINRLQVAIPNSEIFQHVLRDELHIKGILGPDFYLAGSMNSTYSGAYKNDEQLELKSVQSEIIEARLNYEQAYGDFSGR